MFACLLGLPGGPPGPSHGEVRWGPGPAAQWLWWGLLPTSPALFLDRLSWMVASGFRSRWLSWALLRRPWSAARSARGWSTLFSRLCPCVCCFCLLSGPLSSSPLWLVRQLPSVPSGPRHRWQGPRCAVRVAASCATHTPGSRCTEPLPGSWTHPQQIPGSSGPVWGPRVCTRLWSRRARRAVLSQRGPPYVLGSAPGTCDGAPWLLDRFLAQLDSYPTSHLEHRWDSLRRLADRAWAWAAPGLDGGGRPWALSPGS